MHWQKVNHMNNSVTRTASKGQLSLTFVTGSERKHCWLKKNNLQSVFRYHSTITLKEQTLATSEIKVFLVNLKHETKLDDFITLLKDAGLSHIERTIWRQHKVCLLNFMYYKDTERLTTEEHFSLQTMSIMYKIWGQLKSILRAHRAEIL